MVVWLEISRSCAERPVSRIGERKGDAMDVAGKVLLPVRYAGRASDDGLTCGHRLHEAGERKGSVPVGITAFAERHSLRSWSAREGCATSRESRSWEDRGGLQIMSYLLSPCTWQSSCPHQARGLLRSFHTQHPYREEEKSHAQGQEPRCGEGRDSAAQGRPRQGSRASRRARRELRKSD